MPRLFVAIDLPNTHKQKLAALRRDALPGRWATNEKYHLTVRFIGAAEEQDVRRIEDTLACLRGNAFTLQGRGLGVFPSMRTPRVLFAKIAHAPMLIELQAQVEDALRTLGLKAETKPFRPHVTLARWRHVDARIVRSFVHEHRTFTLEPFDVFHFSLYESHLRPEGARYIQRATFGLEQVDR